jgi:hypothetical protein
MGSRNWDRLAAGSGFAAIVLFLIAAFLPGTPPQTTASKAAVVHYFASHHRSGLIAAIAGGLGLICILWFVGSVASAMRKSGESRLADVGLGAAMIALTAFLVSGGITTALFYGTDTVQFTKGLYVTATIVSAFAGFPLAAWIGSAAIGAWRTGWMPRWYAAMSGIAAILALFNGGALAHSGFYSPTGAYGIVALVAVFVWIAVTSAMLIREAERAPRAAAVPA